MRSRLRRIEPRSYRALELQCDFITIFRRLMLEPALYFPFSEWVRDHAKLNEPSPALNTVPEQVAAYATKAEHFLQQHEQCDLGGLAPGASPSSTQIIEALAAAVSGSEADAIKPPLPRTPVSRIS